MSSTEQEPETYPLSEVRTTPKEFSQCIIDRALHKRLRIFARENGVGIRTAMQHAIHEMLTKRGF